MYIYMYVHGKPHCTVQYLNVASSWRRRQLTSFTWKIENRQVTRRALSIVTYIMITYTIDIHTIHDKSFITLSTINYASSFTIVNCFLTCKFQTNYTLLLNTYCRVKELNLDTCSCILYNVYMYMHLSSYFR